MNIPDFVEPAVAWVAERVIRPVTGLFTKTDPADRPTLIALLAAAGMLGFATAWWGMRTPRGWRVRVRWPSAFQNAGEAKVTRVLRDVCTGPDWHVMNHVTLPIAGGTTQVDHIVVSRFGVFVVETKDYAGWVFGGASQPMWTQVLFRTRFRFRNPILQNYAHVCAVRNLLDFVPADAVVSLVVFTGRAEFRTERPAGVISVGELADWLRRWNQEIMSRNRLQFCVGRLETARLAISRQVDVEHAERLMRRHGGGRHSPR